jgi:ribose/xylose/arabinose/galactoside ABC-type transport system permease subunit
MTFVVITACIDLSVGSLVAVAGVVCGSIIFRNENAVFLAIFLGILSSSFLGFITGSMTAILKLPSFIASLSMMTIARGIALVYSNGRPYVLTSEKFKVLGQGYVGIIPIPVIVLFIIILLAYVILKYTRLGRYIYAVGGNENAAIVSGVNSKNVLISVFTINGALAGLAGIVLASRINSGQPAIGTSYELDAIASVVIGGTSLRGGSGKIIGTILGFMIIGIINNGLNLLNVSSYYQLIVKGLIIAGAVMMDQVTKK